jgi:hypothetical protein
VHAWLVCAPSSLRQLDERKDYDKLVAIKAGLATVYGHKVIDALVTKQRKFVREGALKKVCRGGKVKSFHFWLLSDYLIYASPLGGGKYALNRCLELAHLRAFPCAYDPQGGGIAKLASSSSSSSSSSSGGAVASTALPGMELLSNEKSFVALCATAADRDAWLADIAEWADAANGRSEPLGPLGAGDGLKSRAAFRHRGSGADGGLGRPADEARAVDLVGTEERTEKHEKTGKVTKQWTVYFFPVWGGVAFPNEYVE